MQESHSFLLNPRNLRITLYISLAVANLLYGVLYPEFIVVAACGFAFFATLVLIHTRPEATSKAIKIEKTIRLDK
jgi:hypothetical protein